MHLAGFKYAGVSVSRPLHTYQQNVTGTATLLAAMEATGVDRIVFSSSAAVYGTPDVDLVTEETPQRPESPYGESKLIGEWLLADQARATGLRHTSLRYFNVVGSGTTRVFDPSPHNLFPLVFDALIEGRTPTHQRRRLPDARRHLRARLHPRRRPRRRARRRRPPPRRGRAARVRLQPRLRRRRLGRRDHARGRRPSPASTSRPRSARAVPATRPGSSPRANSPRATSTGACGTRSSQMVESAWEARRAAPEA